MMVNLGNREWIYYLQWKAGIQKQLRGKRHKHGKIFKDVHPMQRDGGKDKAGLVKKCEVHFIHVLPLLTPPVVINVCRDGFVITHKLQDEICWYFDISLSSLSLFHCAHVYILAPQQPKSFASKNCVGESHRMGAHYLLIWFKTEVSIHSVRELLAMKMSSYFSPAEQQHAVSLT